MSIYSLHVQVLGATDSSLGERLSFVSAWNLARAQAGWLAYRAGYECVADSTRFDGSGDLLLSKGIPNAAASNAAAPDYVRIQIKRVR